jgi:hypothetical protein
MPGTNAVVATIPKDANDAWILSSMKGNGYMSIDVPPGTPAGDYPYAAMTNMGQCVDPMIHVN